jgi:hypothetical protein
MKKKFTIKSIDSTKSNYLELDNARYLAIIEKNRERIRALASALLSVNGFLLSALLVITFFFLKEYRFTKTIGLFIFGGYFLSMLSVIGSLILIIFSIYIYPAIPISTESEMVNSQLKIFSRERKRLRASFILLSLSICAFLFSLIITALCLN